MMALSKNQSIGKDVHVKKKRRRCNMQECNKFAVGKTEYCIIHGGGKRCKESGCPKGAARPIIV